MSKTLLLLNGQTVILTDDDSDGLAHGSPALASALTGEAHGQAKAYHEAGGGQGGVDGKGGVVQMTFGGREGSHGQGGGVAIHKVLGHSLLHSDAMAKRSVMAEGGFVPLPVVPLQGCASLGQQQQAGGGLDEVFTVTANAQLLPQSPEDKASSSSSSNGQQQEDSSSNSSSGGGGGVEVQDLSSLGGRESQAEGQVQGHARSLSTLVAIIQGEDGTSQTIELSPEDACRLGLPQLLQDTTTTATIQPLNDPVVLATAPREEAQPAPTQECVPVFPEGQPGPGEGQEAVGGEGEEADVSLGPFLLIPEYNADGSIATVLQIRGSEAEAVPDTARATEALGHSAAVLATTQASDGARRATTMATLTQPGHSVQKIRLPLAPQAPQASQAPASTPRRQSCLRGAVPEWRAVGVTQPGSRVSGSSYLRDVAKRTKFRNLTSFLEARQELLGSQDTPSHTPTAAATTSCHQAVPSVTSAKLAPLTTTTTVPLHYHPTNTTITSSPPPAPPPPLEELASTLTIRVNTGPINASTTTTTTATTTLTTTTTATTTTATTTPPIATPTPSIKCAEYSEGVGGSTTLAAGDTTSLTSIVYCSSGGDDTPFAVHLPGGDNTKPLGSSENPIQLVQQGNTFQALQPVQERQLEQITALLQQRRITAPPTTHRDEIYDPKTNMKIVYKVVYPEDTLPGEVGEGGEEGEEEEEEGEVDVGCMKEEEEVWEAQSILVEEKRRGRRPKEWRKTRPVEEDPVEENCVEESGERKQPLSRTRSGRISRPPRHMMKDFKHLRPANFNDDAKDKDTTSFGYLDYDEYLPTEAEKVPEPVISDLPRRKKREVPRLTRLRYTCATCGKLYMGRIEAHYRQFPDHCRKPLSPEDPKQSYSAIKTLSEPTKSSGEDGSEINKSVLSPTPGTQASETSGEPGLPMETLTTQPHITQEDPLGMRLEFEDPQQPPARTRRGRGRRKGRGRRGGGRGGRPPRATTPSTTTLVTPRTKPIKLLEKILSSYTSQDIQNAVGQRLFQNLSPWQLLCSQVDQAGAWPQWQERLRLLEDLLRECREEFHTQTEPLPRPSSSLQEEADLCSSPRLTDDAGTGQDKGAKASDSEPLTKDSIESLGDTGGAEADSNSTVIKEESSNFKVSDYLANILGVMSCEYQLKRPSSSPPSPILAPSPVPPADPYLPQDSNPLHQTTLSSGKRPLDEEGSENTESPPKKREADSEVTVSQATAQEMTPTPSLESDSIETNTEKPDRNKYIISMNCISTDTATGQPNENKYSADMDCVSIETSRDKPNKSKYSISMDCVSIDPSTGKPKDKYGVSMDCVRIETGTDKSNKNKYDVSMDCVSSALEAATCNLSLSAYTLPDQLGPGVTSSHTAAESTPGILRTSAADAQLTTTLPHLSSDCVVVTSNTTHTTLTTTHSSIPATSLPIEIPSFSTHSTSPPTLPPCLPLNTIDSAFSTTPMPQVSTMQQMPLGDMDITAEDLPRLLSEGTGLVVGSSNDGCDPPKLLDTSGDTTDLSEMLFKLQEATAGISQSQETNLGAQMYHESVSGANPQLLSSQGLHAHTGVSLTAQDFSSIGSSLNQHTHPTNNLTHTEARQSTEPSMPLLTFSGALNSGFHNTSSLNQVVGQAEETKIQLSTDFHSNSALRQVVGQAQETNKIQLNTDFHSGSTLSQVVGQAQETNKIQLNTDFHSNSTLSQVMGRGEENKTMQLNVDFHNNSALGQVMGCSEDNKAMQLNSDFHNNSTLGQVISRSEQNKTMQLNSNFHNNSTLGQVVSSSEESTKIQLSSNFHSSSGLNQVISQSDKNKIQLNSNFHSVSRSEENKIQAILSEVSDQLDRGDSERSTNGKAGEREQIDIGFGAANLGMSTLEDLLKR